MLQPVSVCARLTLSPHHLLSFSTRYSQTFHVLRYITMSNKSDKSASSTGSVAPMQLTDIDDDHVRRTRGEVPPHSRSNQLQSPPLGSSSMVGFMTRSIQGLLGATPTTQDQEGAEPTSPAQDPEELQLQVASGIPPLVVHHDTPHHAAPASSSQRDDNDRSPSTSPDQRVANTLSTSSLRRTGRDAEE